MKSIFAGLVLILLAGCATNINQTQAGRLDDENRKLIDDAKAAGQACSSALYQTEAGKIVINQILYVDQTSPNKFDLMSSKAKLNQVQKDALRSFLTRVDECRQIYKLAWSKVNADFTGVINRYDSKIDAIFLALLDDKFTIGDANRAKDKATQERIAEFSAANAQYVQRLQAMDNDEYAQRQRAAAIMMPLLMQQNAINAQNQQNFYNQQMQNIRNNTPRYVPPFNTTCQAIGNQINCTSY
jgi:hypothetical protein